MKYIKTSLILLVFITIILLTNYYIAYNLSQDLSISINNIFILITISSLIIIFGFLRSLLPINYKIKRILAYTSSYLMGTYIYLLLFTIIVSILNLIPSIQLPSIVIIICTLITIIYGIVNAKRIKKVSYEVELKNINNLKLVLISDLHLGAVSSEKRLELIVNNLNNLKPDILCIAGDIFDNDFSAIEDEERIINLFKSIKTKYGIYACLGNHDSGKSFAKMLNLLSKSNIKVLKDEIITIDNKLNILGRLDSFPIGGYNNLKRKDLKEISNIKENLPIIVLDHNPKNIEEYNNKYDLILCGHTHNGQLFPGNIFVKLLFKVGYGYHKKDNTLPNIIVSSGVGTWSMPMRIGTNNEIVTINIKS